MTDQKSGLSIPDKWKERFLIKRIDEKDIEITLEERDAILESLTAGMRFVQIGKYTLMLNSIKSIDPVWEPDNVPTRPEGVGISESTVSSDGKIVDVFSNQDEIDLWDQLFANEPKKLHGGK